MEKFIINEKALLIKNILIKENIILATDENYKTKESFLSNINGEKKSFLNTHLKIKTSDIIKFKPFENENGIQIFFETKKKEKTYFEFNSSEEYSEFKEFLIKETNLKLKKEEKGNFKSWIKKGVYSLFALIATGVIFHWAKKLETGDGIDIGYGRRQGIKKILLYLAETLGSTNALIVGIIITAGLCFWTYKSYLNGKETIEIYS